MHELKRQSISAVIGQYVADWQYLINILERQVALEALTEIELSVFFLRMARLASFLRAWRRRDRSEALKEEGAKRKRRKRGSTERKHSFDHLVVRAQCTEKTRQILLGWGFSTDEIHALPAGLLWALVPEMLLFVVPAVQRDGVVTPELIQELLLSDGLYQAMDWSRFTHRLIDRYSGFDRPDEIVVIQRLVGQLEQPGHANTLTRDVLNMLSDAWIPSLWSTPGRLSPLEQVPRLTPACTGRRFEEEANEPSQPVMA